MFLDKSLCVRYHRIKAVRFSTVGLREVGPDHASRSCLMPVYRLPHDTTTASVSDRGNTWPGPGGMSHKSIRNGYDGAAIVWRRRCRCRQYKTADGHRAPDRTDLNPVVFPRYCNNLSRAHTARRLLTRSRDVCACANLFKAPPRDSDTTSRAWGRVSLLGPVSVSLRIAISCSATGITGR